MHISYSEIFNAFIVLFAVINALGNIPIFINLQKEGKVIYPLKAALMSLFILISFFYIGDTFLSLLGVTVSSFAVAGSFVIFLIGLGMILDMNFFQIKRKCLTRYHFHACCFPAFNRRRNFYHINQFAGPISKHQYFNRLFVKCNDYLCYPKRAKKNQQNYRA